MKKGILLGLLLVAFLNSSAAPFDFIFLRDFPHDMSLDDIPLATKIQLDSIILLPKTEFNREEASNIIKRLAVLPESLLEKINDSHIKIRLFTNKLTDHPTAAFLTGITPRGYANTSVTWDNVPGAGGGKIVLVRIGASHRGYGHGSVNLELHELAHSIDKIAFGGIRNDPKFRRIWQEEVILIFPNNDYFRLYPEEYFAETFAMFYASESTNLFLEKITPKTYEYITNIK